ncbi:MAG: hypothetical protein KBD50_01440 [Candidatus Pacebacteria bacterium]|nr:hypothetical protein [Candidatus Paceibacterota bacterium]
MTRNILIAAGLLVFIVGGVLVFGGGNSIREEQAAPQGKISAETDMAIRTMITEFGGTLKNVSLLSPTVSADIAAHYNVYLAPELLAAWQANPSEALGRNTSSPWPDRIEVVTVSPIGDSQFQAEANVIEVTNADTPFEPAAVYPVTLIIKEEPAGQYWITNVRKGAYSELPQRISVTGIWECVPLTSGLPDSECVPGVARDQSDAHFIVDTMLMSATLTAKVGDHVRVEGVMTPANQLSSDQWQQYPIDGIISATMIQKI